MSKHLKRSRVTKALSDRGLAASFDDAEGLRSRLTPLLGGAKRPEAGVPWKTAAAGPFPAPRHAITMAATRGLSRGSRCPARGESSSRAISWCRYRATRSTMRDARTGLHLDQARINRRREAPRSARYSQLRHCAVSNFSSA